MPMKSKALLALVVLSIVGAHPTVPSYAQDGAAVPRAPVRIAASDRGLKPYFVEFRARSALSYGHTFAVYGRVGDKTPTAKVAGLHPFTDSSIPWMLGHLIPVPSETGASDGDTEDQYIIARYRVLLTEPEYRKMTMAIAKLQAGSPVWHAVLYNCTLSSATSRSQSVSRRLRRCRCPKNKSTA